MVRPQEPLASRHNAQYLPSECRTHCTCPLEAELDAHAQIEEAARVVAVHASYIATQAWNKRPGRDDAPPQAQAHQGQDRTQGARVERPTRIPRFSRPFGAQPRLPSHQTSPPLDGHPIRRQPPSTRIPRASRPIGAQSRVPSHRTSLSREQATSLGNFGRRDEAENPTRSRNFRKSRPDT